MHKVMIFPGSTIASVEEFHASEVEDARLAMSPSAVAKYSYKDGDTYVTFFIPEPLEQVDEFMGLSVELWNHDDGC